MGVVDVIYAILGLLPARWPIPIPLPITTVAATAVLPAITSWVAFDQQADPLANSELLPPILNPACQGSQFDHIIVGAGAAGMVVATRLANASHNSRILLLEAGGEPSVINEIPGLASFLLTTPSNHYIYHGPPNPKCCQNYDNQVSVTPAGKMLGGSTSHNFMMYVRGHKETTGGRQMPGTTSGTMRTCFHILKNRRTTPGFTLVMFFYVNFVLKISDHDNTAVDTSSYHGQGGLLNVATYDFQPGADEYLAAGVEKGYTVGDYNGANQEVFSSVDITTRNGWRESTYRAFYRDTSKPTNLCIKKYANVNKVNFRTSASGRPRAVGVRYTRQVVGWSGLTKTVTATKEVILSAGAVGSPKLLLLSGVGPTSHLQSLQIPVVKDLPVGQNYQDHAYSLVGPFLKSPSTNPQRDLTAQAAAEFVVGGNRALAGPIGLSGHAFWQSPVAVPPYPDLQAIQFAAALYPEVASDLNSMMGVNISLMNAWFDPYQQQNLDARFVVLVLGRPKSVGSVTLASTNPDHLPIVDPQFLGHPDDQDAHLWGFKKIVDLFETTAALNTTLFPKPVSGCEGEVFKSDDYYRCAIRHYSGSTWHQVGSCALGKVVDSKLKVIGIDRLRVIDASIIPRTPNANTQASTIMVGEKGADLVIADMQTQG